jgi:alkylation response protein AidB-like acyl-CoA dehydrogenase
MLASMQAGEPDAAVRRRQMRAVKIEIGRAARFVGQQSIQLHGGIGMTMEYAIGHYFKRLTAIDTLFGDADHHLALLAAEGGLLEAA